MTFASALYFGSVMHRRVKPREHTLRYSVFSMLVDLDELPALSNRLRLFGHNRAAVFGFYDRDHGDGVAGGLRHWVESRLAAADCSLDGGSIKLLCYPRIFGYAFNPLSVYYCFDRDGRLAVLLYEVCNTFGERHTYVIPAAAGEDEVLRHQCAKEMYVSPFIPMACHYKFAMTMPDQTLSVTIDEHDEEGRLLVASFKARRKPISDAMLAQALVRFPLMTLKVTAAIHWQALKLWLKGIAYIPHKAARERVATSIVKPSDSRG